MSQFSAPISPDVPVKFPPPYAGKREDYIAVAVCPDPISTTVPQRSDWEVSCSPDNTICSVLGGGGGGEGGAQGAH